MTFKITRETMAVGMELDPELPNLYEKTFDVLDINTLMINRNELRKLLAAARLRDRELVKKLQAQVDSLQRLIELKDKHKRQEHDAALNQEPAAFRHSYDGFGWLYCDDGSGSSWKEMVYPDKEFLFTRAIPTVVRLDADDTEGGAP